jgi:hypothetical protein
VTGRVFRRRDGGGANWGEPLLQHGLGKRVGFLLEQHPKSAVQDRTGMNAEQMQTQSVCSNRDVTAMGADQKERKKISSSRRKEKNCS